MRGSYWRLWLPSSSRLLRRTVSASLNAAQQHDAVIAQLGYLVPAVHQSFSERRSCVRCYKARCGYHMHLTHTNHEGWRRGLAGAESPPRFIKTRVPHQGELFFPQRPQGFPRRVPFIRRDFPEGLHKMSPV